MDMRDISLPEVYTNSEDFRFFCKWFTDALRKTQYDTENISDLYDPMRCPADLLWALADTMGYTYDDRLNLPTSFNRLVLLYFMDMIYMRGSKNGVTLSAEVRKLSNFYLEVTGSQKDNLDFMLHDFGYRGATSTESSMLCGSAHLLSFSGTDTIPALTIPENYYNDSNLYGFSVQATEHSVMTSLGPEGEIDQILNVIDKAKDGILSIVIDSYNYRDFLINAGKSGSELNEAILNFLDGENNKIVFRPDSGEPVSTTIDCLNLLSEGFGSHLTDEGYKVFDLNIGLLWGDGLNYQKIRDILFAMKSSGWAAQNIIFGMGGGLHSSVTRDTQRNAFKCSAQLRDGVWHDIFKNPLDSSKKSKTGRFKLVKQNNSFRTVSIDEKGEDCLQTVFRNGELLIDDNFADIKSRALKYSNYL